MFCRKCGRGIPEDSAYCCYCGIQSPDAEQENSPEKPQEQEDDCIRPGMPKKNCLDCGKQLPGSYLDDICAICTIRRRNQEIEQEREREDEANAGRDRYDISDEFDQSVFQNETYYHEETAKRFAHGKKAKSGFAKDDAPPSPRIFGCLISVIILGVFLVLLGTGLIFVFSYASENERILDEMVGPALVEETSSDLTNAGNDFYTAGSPDPGEEPENQAGPDAPFEYESFEALFDQALYPITEAVLQQFYIVDGIDLYPSDVWSEGVHIYLSGVMHYWDSAGNESSDIFLSCMMVSDESFLPLFLSVGEGEEREIVFDFLPEVDTDGNLTEIGAAAEGSDMQAGDPIFGDDPPYRLDEMFG